MKIILFTTLLCFATLSFAEQNQPQPDINNNTSNVSCEASQVRPRHHGMSWLYSTATSTAGTISSSKTSLTYGYQYNIGYVEPGINIASENSSSTADVKVSTMGVYVQANMLPNIPINRIIPYGMIGFGSTSVYQGSDSVSAQYTAFGAGIMFFPTTDHFAIRINYVRESASVQGVSVVADAMSCGWMFYF